MHSRFIETFKVDEKLLSKESKDNLKYYNDEMKLKEKIFSKICYYMNGSKKLLYLEKQSPISVNRIGLVYLFDKNEFIHFAVDRDLDITADLGYGNYEDLKKVADVVKKDFNKQVSKIKGYFEKKSMADVSYLELALIDLNTNLGADSIVAFRFGIVDSEFNNELGN
jgi:hypothetical protein